MELTSTEQSTLRTIQEAADKSDKTQFNHLVIELVQHADVRILNALELDYIRKSIIPNLADALTGLDDDIAWNAIELIKGDDELRILWIGDEYVSCNECAGDGELLIFGKHRKKYIDCPWCDGEGTTKQDDPPRLLTDIDGNNPTLLVPHASLQ